jgi:RIO kinase 1
LSAILWLFVAPADVTANRSGKPSCLTAVDDPQHLFALKVSEEIPEMAQRGYDDDLDDLSEHFGASIRVRNIPRKKRNGRAPNPNQPAIRREENYRTLSSLADQQDQQFSMTYKSGRHEALWLEDSLQNFFNHQWFNDVLRMVKGGKEASVYLCQGNETTGLDYLAAKVYRPRRFRNLKNDWLYREGRANLDESGNRINNKGMLHAMRKRTEYGRELLHTSWLEHEFTTLKLLYEAGGDVPKPLASDSNAILMEYLGDEIMGAPTLNDVSLTAGEAGVLFERVIHNIDLMLEHSRIHADLSAFNILYWEGEISLIDFPQAIHPNENRSAYRIFERDVLRVCEYFQRQGVKNNPRKLSADLWQKHQFRFVSLVDPKMIGEDREDERDIWESLKNT